MLVRKSLNGVEVKADGNGHVEAVFATLNTKDHDGDVTLPGAFENGAEVRISAYNHASWGGALPIGKGRIFEEGERVVFRGEFFDTQAAQDTRKTLIGLGDMGEWSYGFDVVDSERGEFKGENVRLLKRMKVHEVSPVMLGAGIGTRTTAIKSGEGATLNEEIGTVVEAIESVIARAERVEALRAEKGLELTESVRISLEGLDEKVNRLKALISTPAEGTADEAVEDDVLREYLRFIADHALNEE